MDSDDGCAESEAGRGGATLGMNEVTTATGCAVSRRSARIFWERPRALMLLAARSKEDRRFAVTSATAKRDIMDAYCSHSQCRLMFVLVRDFAVINLNSVNSGHIQFASSYPCFTLL